MKKIFLASLSCLFLWVGLAVFASAADPVNPAPAPMDGEGSPTNNGWTQK